MTERPILFSGAMVRAILQGRKQQTRRALRVQPPPGVEAEYDTPTGGAMWGSIHGDHGTHCPYGKPGDRLWVRETFAVTSIARAGDGFDVSIARAERMPAGKTLADTDGGLEVIRVSPDVGTVKVDCERWRPAIFMPRWACRLVLEVIGVRVERLQHISNADAKAEGVHGTDWGHGLDYGGDANYVPVYRALWDSLNAKRGVGWAANPWVWVVEFRRAA